MKRVYFRNSPATWVLVLINVAIFAALNLAPSIADVVLLDPNSILERPWSLFTVFFSHQLWIHILLNMLLLVVFGMGLEKETNAGVLFGVYTLCGFLGSLSIPVFARIVGYSAGPVAGASASAFGVAAAYAALRPEAVVLKSKAKHWVVALFVVNALLTLQNPKVSVGGPAHALGLAVGFALGYALRKSKREERPHEH